MTKGRLCSLTMVAASTLAAFLLNGTVSASPQVLTISPTAVNLLIKPGTVNKGSFLVINQGKTKYTFTVYAAPYSVKGENYTPDFSPIPGKSDVTSWLQFSPNQATIQSNQSVNITYTLTVPGQVVPGGYYAVAFAKTQLPNSNQGVKLSEQVGHIFYLQVAGPAKQAGTVQSWQVRFLQTSLLLTDLATLRIEDSGSVQYTSKVDIIVRDILGTPKYEYSTQKVILPQTIRKIPATWDHAPSFALMKVTGTVTILGHNQSLPTKYVLIMSTTAKAILGVSLLIIVSVMMIRYAILAQRGSKKQ